MIYIMNINIINDKNTIDLFFVRKFYDTVFVVCF